MITWAYQYDDPLLDRLGLLPTDCDRQYHDLGQRQQREQLLRDCRDRPPTRLQVRSIAELGDSLTEIGQIIQELSALDIEILELEPENRGKAASEVFGDTSLVQWIENQQDQQHRRRLQQGHARKRLQALPPPGKAPYGYRRGRDRYLIDRSTAPVIKDFFDQFLLYGSLRRAVRHLEKRYGKSIAVSTGRRWLTHPVYRGDLLYHNGEIVANTHAPLLQREEAAQIDRLLRRNQSLPPRTASAPRSLAGLVFCQTCQSAMTVTQVKAKNRSPYLYLRPSQCSQNPKCRAITYQSILEQTIDRICLDLPPSVAKLELPDLERIKEGINHQIQQKKDLIEQIPALQDQGIFDPATATLRQYTLRTEIAQLQADRDRLPPGNLKVIAQAVSLPEFWLDLSESERRFYFREFIRQIDLLRLENGAWQVQLRFIF